MKRKMVSLLIAAVLLLSPAVCSAAAADPQAVSFDLKAAGLGFDLPEELQHLTGVIQPGYGVEIDQGSGVYLSALTYCAMSKDKYRELSEKGAGLTDEDKAFLSARMIDFVLLYTIDGSRSAEDLKKVLESYGLPAEGLEELGSAGEYNFFSIRDPFSDLMESQFTFDEEAFRKDYETVTAACEDLSWIRLSEPEKEDTSTAAAGSGISFQTTDLAGNPVDSVSLFSAHKLTMVNIWGTYCGPCINEMPDLEVLNARLAEKDCAIIGVVCDITGAQDTELIQTAEDIIADTGVTYLNLIPWDSMRQDLPAAFIPTTYFIDSTGTIVGEAAVGARGADEYEALIDAVLDEMGQ